MRDFRLVRSALCCVMERREDGGSRATARGWEGGAGLEGQLREEPAGAGMGDAAALERRCEGCPGTALVGESVAGQAVQSRTPREAPVSARGCCGLEAVGPASLAASAGERSQGSLCLAVTRAAMSSRGFVLLCTFHFPEAPVIAAGCGVYSGSVY